MKTITRISSGLKGACKKRKFLRILNLTPFPGGSSARAILIGIIFLLDTYLVPGGSPMMTEETRKRTERYLFYFEVRNQSFSEELLKKCLEFEGVMYQDIVILQSRLETGYYTSDIFQNANNLFGMRYPSRRSTVATGIYKEHAQYDHWSDSVIDYALWQQYYLSRGYRLGGEIDSDFYLVFLNCIPYAEDRRYVSKLVQMSGGDLT